jgi:hypothetical protein
VLSHGHCGRPANIPAAFDGVRRNCLGGIFADFAIETNHEVTRKALHAASTHRRHGLHRTTFAAGTAEPRLPKARAAAPADCGADMERERDDWRSPRPRNMSAALEGVAAVIHSAGLAQAMSGVPEDD